ncbi:MAG TPA: hypothetical protein VLB07_03500 [Woeseiaceae bacterium]|nr:hypothetical protein [Woeseiaceae bacterium]
MNTLNKVGAISFILWGLLHVVGGAAILAALADGPAQGYAVYLQHAGSYTALSGAILGYFAYLILVTGVAATVIGGWLNWRNSQAGLAVNTIMIGVVDAGLVYFLVLPGFVSWGDAAIGLVLYTVAIVTGGLACNAGHRALPVQGSATALR